MLTRYAISDLRNGKNIVSKKYKLYIESNDIRYGENSDE